MTIYANTAMCELLSIENIEEIKDIPDRKFLDISKAPRTNNSPSYQTILVDKNGSRHEVYVSEQTVVHDADAMSVRVRTVVDINRLTLDRDDTNQKNEPRHLETSAEQTGNKFTAAA
jgi:hypothetical protein